MRHQCGMGVCSVILPALARIPVWFRYYDLTGMNLGPNTRLTSLLLSGGYEFGPEYPPDIVIAIRRV